MKRWLPAAAWVAASLVPALALYAATASWPDTPDGLFHLQRVRALAEALRAGVLYPRWFPDFAFGYGYPVLTFYAPAFYYPPALLHLIGLDVLTAVRIALALGYGLSGIAMFALLRHWVRPAAAVVGTLLYLVFPYRLYDLFVRGALPEFAAFLWLPLAALTTVRWVESVARAGRNVRQWDAAALAVAALSWAALVLTHNLTALMAGIAALAISAALGAATLGSADRAEAGPAAAAAKAAWRAAVALLPVAAGGALSAFYVLPALVETSWVGLGATPGLRSYARHFAALGELLDRGSSYGYPAAAEPSVPAPIYTAVIVMAALPLILAAPRRRVILATSAALAVASLWLTTSASAPLWDAAAPILGKLQFPWRWQTLAGLALACLLALEAEILAGWAAKQGREAGSMRGRPVRRAGFAALAGLVGCYLVCYSLVGLRYLPTPFKAADLTAAQMWSFDTEHGQVGATWTGEFLPRWVTEQRWAIGRESSEPWGEAPAPGIESRSLRSARVTAQSYLGERLIYDAPAPVPLVYHAFYYPAWRVEVDGRPVPTRALGPLGLLAVELPAGQHEVVRRWSATPAVWAGRSLSGLAWLAMLGLFVVARNGRRQLWIGLWLSVAALAVVAGSGWLARQQPAVPAEADFGTARLASAATTPGHAGETVTVTLHWLVTAPSGPLTAFTHLLAADGGVVTGHDAPLGGVYTPASRWMIGELLPDHHVLQLPADLPPGVYRLKAGLYRPQSPDTPLVPAGGSATDPRIDIGVLEVRP